MIGGLSPSASIRRQALPLMRERAEPLAGTRRRAKGAQALAVMTKHSGLAHDVKSIGGEALSSERAHKSRLVRHLHRQMANAFLLYLNYKHCQWLTYGPAFRDLHLLFGDLAKEVLDGIDHIAERINLLGHDVPGHVLELINVASISVAARHSSLRDMVEEGDRNLRLILKEMRRTAELAGEYRDPATVQLTARIAEIHRQHEAWLQDILNKRDGPQLD
jgi:starvation-inducible DNA-binding protein